MILNVIMENMLVAKFYLDSWIKGFLQLKWICVLIFLTEVTHAELPNFVPLIAENAVAVVNISTFSKTTNPPQQGNSNISESNELANLSDLLKRYMSSRPHTQGSGFIFSKEGYIVTNYHVVENAEKIIVKIHNRKEFKADLIGVDQASDIALLKINAYNLPVLKLGNSNALQVGEWVFAIGSPFGLSSSSTAGIISALNRFLPWKNYVSFIQTDVAINPGNSGGPLFNLKGEVVGVNTQIYSRTGGFMGLSFSVPIETVEFVCNQLIERGYVSRGWLGVFFKKVGFELAQSLQMETPYGVLVTGVAVDGPAALAGIKVGDIIKTFNGKTINFSTELPLLVAHTQVGLSVPVEIIKDKKIEVFDVKIAESPFFTSKQEVGMTRAKSLGIQVRSLQRLERERLNIPLNKGVVVNQIETKAVQAAGVKKGDVILLVNNTAIRDITHFANLAFALPSNQTVPVLLQRDQQSVFVSIKPNQ